MNKFAFDFGGLSLRDLAKFCFLTNYDEIKPVMSSFSLDE